MSFFRYGLMILGLLLAHQGYAHNDQYPKIMAMNIGNSVNYSDPKYQTEMSKADALVLVFWPKWGEYKYGPMAVSGVIKNIKSLNPSILVGQYTNLNESTGLQDTPNMDKAIKLGSEGWWLQDAFGNKLQWISSYNAWDINITEYTRPDTKGMRYSEWLAERNYLSLFKNVPQFDFWYLDNSLSKSPVDRADWRQDGTTQNASDPEIAKSYRMGHVRYWQAIKQYQPTTLLMGNSDDLSSLEYSQKLNGAFFEAAIGKSYSIEKWKGWEAMLQRYYSHMQHTASPHMVGFNVWGKANDYQKMRYGLTTCLLNNGYFSYTDEEKGYASVPWFDEYDVKLGQPIEEPPTKPWQNGVYRRKYQNGMVLVNPALFQKEFAIESGYKRILGVQAKEINNGMPVSKVVLNAKDGLILVNDKITPKPPQPVTAK